MITLLVTLTIIGLASIALGYAMGSRRVKFAPIPKAKYDRWYGKGVNHLGDN